MVAPLQRARQAVLGREQFDQLLDALVRRGYRVVGPTVRDGAICYDEVTSTAQMPEGWTDEQEGGHYRLKKRGDAALFGYSLGPHSWKKFLNPPALRLWQASRNGNRFKIVQEAESSDKTAFIGVRACELAAISIQDKVLSGGQFTDPHYTARRKKAFIVAVNCAEPGETCFCESLGTGPEAGSGFDIVLTEVLEKDRHYFVAKPGSPIGAEVLGELSLREPSEAEASAARQTMAGPEFKRSVDISDVRDLLYRNSENPRWEETANRCMTCANCTMVCPTCFCVNIEDVTDLTGQHAERWKKWDSCFTMEFSYIHGGSLRTSVKARYRQFVTHKFSAWADQFGSLGCVGCGRCITWCPSGIDITREIEAIRETDLAPASATK